jgi:prolyl-tRNA synthetase
MIPARWTCCAPPTDRNPLHSVNSHHSFGPTTRQTGRQLLVAMRLPKIGIARMIVGSLLLRRMAALSTAFHNPRRLELMGVAVSKKVSQFTSPSTSSKRSTSLISQQQQQHRYVCLFSTATEDDLEALIQAKGDEIRAMKETGADKATVAPLVAELLALKAQLNPAATTAEAVVPAAAAATTKTRKNPEPSAAAETKNEEESSDFITPRAEDFSKWYNDLIRVAGLAENSPVRGCMVVKPWGMALWDLIKEDLNRRIVHEHGAENAYFPLLIPQSFLAREAQHVDGFAKECAVVTHHRLTTTEEGQLIVDPDAKLEEPLIIRPTSETMIWYMFRKWIVSHRDLPLKINQWANVLRWELRTRPFVRTAEFLWQEGHTAHTTAAGANDDAVAMLHQYQALCESTLALPVVPGIKSPSERFAGAAETYTIEALMQNGWALQSGTSHFLGQSFGKAFDVTFQDEAGKQQTVWGTSWGVSTRLIGAMIMAHSDDAGLVLPPKVAPVQVVIFPIPPKKLAGPEQQARIDEAVEALRARLSKAGVRVKVDSRDYLRLGAKTYEWERKGVPIRIKIGPRDVENGSSMFKYRLSKMERENVALDDAVTTVQDRLAQIHDALFAIANQRLQDGIRRNVSYDELKEALIHDEASVFPGNGLFLVPWKCDAANEAAIKQECKATIRCYPLDAQNELQAGQKCFYSGDDATHMALFGRAF